MLNGVDGHVYTTLHYTTLHYTTLHYTTVGLKSLNKAQHVPTPGLTLGPGLHHRAGLLLRDVALSLQNHLSLLEGEGGANTYHHTLHYTTLHYTTLHYDHSSSECNCKPIVCHFCAFRVMLFCLPGLVKVFTPDHDRNANTT